MVRFELMFSLASAAKDGKLTIPYRNTPLCMLNWSLQCFHLQLLKDQFGNKRQWCAGVTKAQRCVQGPN